MKLRVLASAVFALLVVGLVAGPAMAQDNGDQANGGNDRGYTPAPPNGEEENGNGEEENGNGERVPPDPTPPDEPPDEVLDEIIFDDDEDEPEPVTDPVTDVEQPERVEEDDVDEVLGISTQRTLPVTGSDILILIALGATLISLGYLAIRRRGSPEAG